MQKRHSEREMADALEFIHHWCPNYVALLTVEKRRELALWVLDRELGAFRRWRLARAGREFVTLLIAEVRAQWSKLRNLAAGALVGAALAVLAYYLGVLPW